MGHLSSTSLRQRQVPKTDIIDDIDGFVQIPPIKQERLYSTNRDTSESIDDLSPVLNETGHPVIFRMLMKRKQSL